MPSRPIDLTCSETFFTTASPSLSRGGLAGRDSETTRVRPHRGPAHRATLAATASQRSKLHVTQDLRGEGVGCRSMSPSSAYCVEHANTHESETTGKELLLLGAGIRSGSAAEPVWADNACVDEPASRCSTFDPLASLGTPQPSDGDAVRVRATTTLPPGNLAAKLP